MGHKVEFVLLRACGELLPEAQSNFVVSELDCPRIRQVPVVLARYLRARRPDALLAQMWPLTVVAPFAGYLSRDSHRCTIAVTEHNTLSIQYRGRGLAHELSLRASTAVGYRLADARVGVSAGVAADMSRLSGIARRRFAVIHNPIPKQLPPSPSEINQLQASWGEGSGERILTVGSLKPQKNQCLLLNALAKLSHKKARLLLVGKGSEEAALRRLVDSLGIANRVVFAGFVQDPRPYYSAADLFVLSSNYEGFGNVIVEALSCGTPVVSTDCPSGPREILQNGKHGILVPIGDTEALAGAIDAALSQPHDKERLRARALDFLPVTAARAYLDLLFPKKAKKND